CVTSPPRRSSSPAKAGNPVNTDVSTRTATAPFAECLAFAGHDESESSAGTLCCGTAQNGFQCGVEIAPHLRHTFIAILAKERRRLVISKDSPAVVILEQNHPQRRVERGGEAMAGHLRGGKRISDVILQRVASAARNLQQGAVIALAEDRQLRPVLFV